MLEQMLSFWQGMFSHPSIIGIGLAMGFGAIWLAIYRPPLFKKPWLWAVMAGSAILAPIAFAIWNFPATRGIIQFYVNPLGREVFFNWILLAGLVPLSVAGLIQVGFKLIPVIIYWWYQDRKLDPKIGLAAGAVAGAGFGIIEAVWTHDYIFASGWTWAAVETQGLVALAGFWERFFVVGWNVAACALAGWGLAKGKGWQFYLLATLLFVLLNYTSYLISEKIVKPEVGEMIVAAWAFLVTGVALWLSERKEKPVACN
jgi:hypothetical protein